MKSAREVKHIYALAGRKDLVAKIYHHPEEHDFAKLTLMLENPPADPENSNGHVAIAWPIDLLITNQRQGVGFLMPRISGLHTLFSIYNPQSRQKTCPRFTYKYLVRVARNLATAVSALHAASCVIGDINESNTMVSSDALITLVDTDSCQIRNPLTNEIFRCPVGKGEFTPPELQGETFREHFRQPAHDLFGLAVLIFQLLMEGIHPFADVPVSGDAEPLETRCVRR